MKTKDNLNITQNYVLKLFKYDHETGLFTKNGKPFGTKSVNGYVRFLIDKRLYLAHRIAWLYYYGNWPSNYLDHINGIKDDNRISNLRLCSNMQNQFNVGLSASNKSGYKGVCWVNHRNRWRAQARINRKLHYIGEFTDVKLAAQAYIDFVKKHHHDFLWHKYIVDGKSVIVEYEEVE
jgi:hypothetical protein